MKRKILILGERGMLGSCVHKYFSRQGIFDILVLPHTEERRSNQELFLLTKNFCESEKIEFIINCIGAIPQKNPRDYKINYEFPIFILENIPSVRLVQPDTDCVFSGETSNLANIAGRESPIDEYGRSKYKLSCYVKYEEDYWGRIKMLRSSVVGFDSQNLSLLGWLRSQSGRTVKGYTNHYWNGITVLTWAQEAEVEILRWLFRGNNICYDAPGVLQGGSHPVSKYNLLCFAKKVFDINVEIVPHTHDIDINRCLYPIVYPHIKQQLEQYKQFLEND